MACCGFLIATRRLTNNKLPDGPLARMHLMATKGNSFECLALPSTKEAAPVGGATCVAYSSRGDGVQWSVRRHLEALDAASNGRREANQARPRALPEQARVVAREELDPTPRERARRGELALALLAVRMFAAVVEWAFQ